MGGARQTSNRGPWAMVLIVYGFPNMISSLRFEWAWQHPQRSRRLNHLPPKKKNESLFQYHIKLLSHMLNLGPWNRLPLNVRWLRPDLKGDIDFCNELPPPMHMSITYGPIMAAKKKKPKTKDLNYDQAPSKQYVSTSRNIMFIVTPGTHWEGGDFACFTFSNPILIRIT